MVEVPSRFRRGRRYCRCRHPDLPGSAEPYVTNTDVHTGVGREVLYRKLNNIQRMGFPGRMACP